MRGHGGHGDSDGRVELLPAELLVGGRLAAQVDVHTGLGQRRQQGRIRVGVTEA